MLCSHVELAPSSVLRNSIGHVAIGVCNTSKTTPLYAHIACRNIGRVGHFNGEGITRVCLCSVDRNTWGVRPFSRFSRSGLPIRRLRSTPLYAAGGRIFISSTSTHSLLPSARQATLQSAFFITNK